MKRTKIKNAILYRGDNAQSLRRLPANSVHSIVTDPPYGMSDHPDATLMLKSWLNDEHYTHHSKGGFMSHEWDSFVPQPILWKQCFRVLKPGGHCLAFFSTRTFDLGVLAMRLAGFEVRDSISWMYGNGFPKNRNISADIAKNNKKSKRYVGWGTALKPAQELIVVARKPLSGRVADNVLAHGTGGLNIDGCRVEFSTNDDSRIGKNYEHKSKYGFKPNKDKNYNQDGLKTSLYKSSGRFPANVILTHDVRCKKTKCHSDCPIHIMDTQSGDRSSARIGNSNNPKRGGNSNPLWGMSDGRETKDYRDSGGASRFFYCAKVSRSERNAGLEHLATKDITNSGNVQGLKKNVNTSTGKQRNPNTQTKNDHPTVKPLALMRYLTRLVTPPNGIVLDPFMGSGTTGCAAQQEGFKFIGMEKESDYYKIATARIKHWTPKRKLFG